MYHSYFELCYKFPCIFQCSIILFGRTLIAQYSSKQEITLPSVDPSSAGAGTTLSVTKSSGGGNGRILLITVTNIQFPVTLEVIHQV